jgi:hypothetical protein
MSLSAFADIAGQPVEKMQAPIASGLPNFLMAA